MQIRINDQDIDFKLETETTLGQTVEGVEDWLKDSDFAIESMRLGNRELSMEPREAWQDIPVGNVETLDMTVRRLEEMAINSFDAVHGLLRTLHTAIGENDLENLEDLLDGLASVREHLGTVLGVESDIDELNRLLAGASKEPAESWTAELKSHVRARIEHLAERVSSYVNEAVDPLQSLAGTREEMRESVDQLGEVSVLLQTGKDRDAMEHVVRFSDLTGSLLRVFSHLCRVYSLDINTLTVEGKSSRDFYADLIAILRELLQAFEAKDAVLIGDLLEYEIAPRVEALIKLSENLEEMACRS